MWRPCFLLAALTACAHPAASYSNGKVSAACGDMLPQHGHASRPDPPPYVITVDTDTFSPGDNITVSLQAAASSFFKGFLIEVRDADKLDFPAGGVFHLPDTHQSQVLQCGHAQGSGVSHRSGSKKTHAEAVWESPARPPQRVQVLVTVVRDYKEYWARLAGPVLTRGGSTAAPAPTSSPAALPGPFSSAGCSHAKSCLRDPVGCRPQSDPHCFFLSFSADGAGQSVMFELSGPADGYVSFALSLDKWMGNDDAYLCVSDGSRVSISAAHVSGRQAPEPATEDALWGKAWRLADGVIQCRFHRNVSLPDRFGLNTSYFLFLAHGGSDQGFIQRHKRQPLISSSRAVITGGPEDLHGSRSPLLIKFHGVLMLTVWMWMASTAVVVARHYKRLWPDAALLGQRPWFQVHRTLMVLAVVLTAVAFVLPFVYRRGWSKRAGAHPYIGCVVLLLCVIQPVMAIFRPAPESPRRVVFNWLHRGTGAAAQILAAAGLVLGAAQPASLLPSAWSPAALSGWLLWIVLAELLLFAHSCRRLCAGNDGEEEEKILSERLDRRQHGETSQFKKMVLVIFVTGNTVFLAAFIKAFADL